MSAIVCGKRSFFEDLQTQSPTSSSPPVAKRIRCSSSTSPVRFSPSQVPSHISNLINQLRATFPDMDFQLLEKALEESGNDMDSAIKRLHELRLGYAEGRLDTGEEVHENAKNEEEEPAQDASHQGSLPVDGTEWVELFVTEMINAKTVDEARCRATRVLEDLEKYISARVGAEAAQSFHKENMTLKEQIEALLRENSILKRAVAIQHERQKEYDERNQEVQQLKQLVVHYQEQLRNLEVNNYALTMHLRQAQQGNSIPGRFHPDIF